MFYLRNRKTMQMRLMKWGTSGKHCIIINTHISIRKCTNLVRIKAAWVSYFSYLHTLIKEKPASGSFNAAKYLQESGAHSQKHERRRKPFPSLWISSCDFPSTESEYPWHWKTFIFSINKQTAYEHAHMQKRQTDLAFLTSQPGSIHLTLPLCWSAVFQDAQTPSQKAAVSAKGAEHFLLVCGDK